MVNLRLRTGYPMVVVFLLATLASPAQAGRRKPIDSVRDCWETELSGGNRCSTDLSSFEMELQMFRRDFPSDDVTPYQKTYDRAVAARKAEGEIDNIRSYAGTVAHFIQSTRPGECATEPGGCDRLRKSLADLDYPATLARIKGYANNPKTADKGKSALADIEEIKADMKGFSDAFAKEADDQVAVAKRFQKENPMTAEAVVDRALVLCQAAGTFAALSGASAGSCKQATAMKTQIAQAREALYTSPLHKKNVNKILFSSEYQQAGKENQAAFKSAFSAGQPLFGIAYLKATLGDLSGNDAAGQSVNVAVHLEVDGKEIGAAGYVEEPGTPSYKETFVSFEVYPRDSNDVGNLFFTSSLTTALATLSPGSRYKVEVTVSITSADNSTGGNVATGSFDYDASGSMDAVTATAQKLEGKVLDTSRMPDAGMKDPALEKKMLAAVANNEFGDKPLRAVITDRVFDYKRNALTGIMLSRSIHAAVATKGKDNTCMVRYYIFGQEAVGKGFATPTATYPSNEYAIRCENTNKK